MPMWIDSHCHLDAPEFSPDRDAARARARSVGVGHCVIPAVERSAFDAVRTLAHAHGDSYALGIHPLYVAHADDADLDALDEQLHQHADDPRLVAVGEIGLDYFVPALCEEPMRSRQEDFYLRQLGLASRHGLPVILHVRRSADRLLRGLRAVRPPDGGWHGIAHAFAGSRQQADAFVEMGFCLGFGGALTFERALRLRQLVQHLPLKALVLETDAPDIVPTWLYRTAAERADGSAQSRNEPAQLPAIAAVVAQLRGLPVPALAEAVCENCCRALPRLRTLLV
jgi:TatD DNase family protein